MYYLFGLSLIKTEKKEESVVPKNLISQQNLNAHLSKHRNKHYLPLTATNCLNFIKFMTSKKCGSHFGRQNQSNFPTLIQILKIQVYKISFKTITENLKLTLLTLLRLRESVYKWR